MLTAEETMRLAAIAPDRWAPAPPLEVATSDGVLVRDPLDGLPIADDLDLLERLCELQLAP
jgi:hypothetical protein